MIADTVVRLVSEIVGPCMVKVGEPMSRHTTFRAGGNADLWIEPSETGEIRAVCKLLRQLRIPYMFLGNGSNVLVGDRGIRGAVISLGNAYAACTAEGNTIRAQAGIKLSRLASYALGNALTGLEFAAGIPGTLGGALYMNAGAYDGEMKQIVSSVQYLDEKNTVQTLEAKDLEFGYRQSVFMHHPDWVILGATMSLCEGDAAQIRAKMDDLAKRRKEKQPLQYPSAGSTFRRPEGYFAGKLIQDAGLMGLRVGGASVSTKHAGFIVNDQNATAAEIRTLIETVQNKVEEKFGVRLMPEVRFLGEF